MAYNVRKNWATSFELIVTKPIVLLPFIIVAFFEGLALELIYFFPRRPLANLAGPIIRKFFGEAFLHYPGSLILLPRLFYYAQLAIYVLCGVLLMGIAVNILQNLKLGLTLQTSVLLRKAIKRYLSFLGYGLIMVGLLFALKKLNAFAFFKIMGLVSEELPRILLKLMPFIFTLLFFLSNVILQAFLILTVPIIVIKDKPLVKALGRSISLSARNFSSIFTLIFLPFLIYLPILLLKMDLPRVVDRTFPEINLYTIVLGIFVAVFVECFVLLCAAQFLLDKDNLS